VLVPGGLQQFSWSCRRLRGGGAVSLRCLAHRPSPPRGSGVALRCPLVRPPAASQAKRCLVTGASHCLQAIRRGTPAGDRATGETEARRATPAALSIADYHPGRDGHRRPAGTVSPLAKPDVLVGTRIGSPQGIDLPRRDPGGRCLGGRWPGCIAPSAGPEKQCCRFCCKLAGRAGPWRTPPAK